MTSNIEASGTWDVWGQWRPPPPNGSIPAYRPMCGKDDQPGDKAGRMIQSSPPSPLSSLNITRPPAGQGPPVVPSRMSSCMSLTLGRLAFQTSRPKILSSLRPPTSGEGKAPATVNRYLQVLSQVFSTAIAWGQAQENPVDDVALLRLRNMRDPVSNRRGGRPTPSGVLALPPGGGPCSDPYRLPKNRTATLTWGDADFRRSVVRIRAEHAKSGEIREVPMDKTLHRLLTDLKPKVGDHTRAVFISRWGAGSGI